MNSVNNSTTPPIKSEHNNLYTCSGCQQAIKSCGVRTVKITKCAHFYHAECLNNHCHACNISINKDDYLQPNFKALHIRHPSCAPEDLLLVDAIYSQFPILVNKLLQNRQVNPNSCCQPLNIAIQRSSPEVVERLLTLGADPNAYDQKSRITPMFHAALRGDEKITSLLINANANPNIGLKGRTRKFLFIEFNFSQINPLTIAASKGNMETVQQLLNAGASHSLKNYGHYGTHSFALHSAVESKSHEVVKQLLVAKANPNAPDRSGKTPLHIAAKSGCSDIAKLLLEFDADPEAVKTILPFLKWNSFKRHANQTPKKIALRNDHNDIASLIQNAIDEKQRKKSATE